MKVSPMVKVTSALVVPTLSVACVLSAAGFNAFNTGFGTSSTPSTPEIALTACAPGTYIPTGGVFCQALPTVSVRPPAADLPRLNPGLLPDEPWRLPPWLGDVLHSIPRK